MAEPVLISIAAALASRAVISLYTLVKDRFADDPTATAALEAAEGAAEDSPEVRRLEEKLAAAESADPDFARRLRREWDIARQQHDTGAGAVLNSVSGRVDGNVVQARDIHGDITF